MSDTTNQPTNNEREQYEHPYTHLIIADVANQSLSVERVEALQEDFAAHPTADPEYLASLNEALTYLLTPEQLVQRARDREGQPPAPDGEVQ